MRAVDDVDPGGRASETGDAAFQVNVWTVDARVTRGMRIRARLDIRAAELRLALVAGGREARRRRVDLGALAGSEGDGAAAARVGRAVELNVGAGRGAALRRVEIALARSQALQVGVRLRGA